MSVIDSSAGVAAGSAASSAKDAARSVSAIRIAPSSISRSDSAASSRFAASALRLSASLRAALATDVQTLIAWRFLQGLLLPPIFAVTVAYIGDEWPPGDIAGVAGVYMAGSSLGGFAGDERGVLHHAEEHDRDSDIKQGAYNQRGNDAEGQIFLWIARFFSCSRD